MPPGKLELITDDEMSTADFKAIPREAIASQVDFTPLGATSFEREMKMRQALMEVMTIIGQFSQMIPKEDLKGYDFGLLFQTLFGSYTEIPEEILKRAFPDKEQQAGPPQGDAFSEQGPSVGLGGDATGNELLTGAGGNLG